MDGIGYTRVKHLFGIFASLRRREGSPCLAGSDQRSKIQNAFSAT